MSHLKIIILIILISSTLHVQAQAPELPERDNHIYPGLYWGAAGMSKAMIQLLAAGVLSTQAEAEANLTLQRGLDAIWHARMESYDGEIIPSWRKVDGGSIYPGLKYGASGIASVFLDAYQLTLNATYLSWANASIYEVYNQAQHFELPHWSYDYLFYRDAQGVYITDLSYGSLGIVQSTLQLINTTHDQFLLQKALDAMTWLYNISYPREVNGEPGRILPWYAATKELNITYTSYTQGNAGAIPVLNALYDITGNSTWINWADFIGQWLISKQRDDGSWKKSPGSELEDVGLNFEEGVPGVIYGLLQLRTTPQGKQEAIDQGIAWLRDQFISGKNIFPAVEGTTNAQYSLYRGMAGISRVLRLADSNTTELAASYNTLLNSALYQSSSDTSTLLLAYPGSDHEDYVDLSYTHGLSGIISELLAASQQGYISINSQLFDQYIHTMKYYQRPNGLWNRQITPAKPNFFERIPLQLKIISGLSLMAIIVFVYRQRQQSQII